MKRGGGFDQTLVSEIRYCSCMSLVHPLDSDGTNLYAQSIVVQRPSVSLSISLLKRNDRITSLRCKRVLTLNVRRHIVVLANNATAKVAMCCSAVTLIKTLTPTLWFIESFSAKNFLQSKMSIKVSGTRVHLILSYELESRLSWCMRTRAPNGDDGRIHVYQLLKLNRLLC